MGIMRQDLMQSLMPIMLVYLSTEVLPLVDPHPVVAPVHGDHAAGPDGVPHAHHAHVVGVLAPPHEVLVAHVVGAVVHHEAAPLHPAGVAPVHVGGHVGAVAHALVGAALEVPLLVEGDLAHHVHAGRHLCVGVVSAAVAATVAAAVAV